MLSKYHLDNLSDLCPLSILISTGQHDDTISSESRRHRHSGDESHSPKAANGTAIRLASISSSSYESNSALPKLVSEVNQELLTSGAVILPGRGRVTADINCFHFDPTACLTGMVCALEQANSSVLYCMFIIFNSLNIIDIESDGRYESVTVSVDPLLAFSLPGNRDRSGRSVLQVCTRAQVWAGESCTVNDLICLLGYYYSTLR